VPERKLSFSPTCASGSNFNPRNTTSIPDEKIINTKQAHQADAIRLQGLWIALRFQISPISKIYSIRRNCDNIDFITKM